MINTIEIAPHIVAYALAKFLAEHKYDFIDIIRYSNDIELDQEDLRVMILDFLKDQNGQVVAI